MQLRRQTNKMKKLIKSVLFVFMLFLPCLQLLAQTPGTSSDPLVTKSYLDFAARFRTVDVKSGTVITAESGALLVVMDGQIRLELKKGAMIIDLTSGRKITSNSVLQAFHLYMVTDGSVCSFKATKNTTLMALGLNDEME